MCIRTANGGKAPKEMTPQEAYEMLQARYVFIAEGIFESYKVTDKLFEALEKQIPKKPHQEEFELGECCPNCEYIFDGFPNYCEYCGQRIDWSDTE
jgi:hypothetical protein